MPETMFKAMSFVTAFIPARSRFLQLMALGTVMAGISGCSPFTKVNVTETDYKPRPTAVSKAPELVPPRLAPLVPASARSIWLGFEPIANAPAARSKVSISFKAGNSAAPIEVLIECEPLKGGWLRCLTVKRTFGPIRDEVGHVVLAWGGLIPVAWLSTSAAGPLAVSYHLGDIKVRTARPVSAEQGSVLFDVMAFYQAADKSLKQRVACYRPLQARARVPEALARFGTVQQVECVRQQMNAQGEFAVTLFEGREFTAPVFYLPDHGLALPVWMFYSSADMRAARFYTDPNVITQQVEGDRRDLTVEIERFDAARGASDPKAIDQ